MTHYYTYPQFDIFRIGNEEFGLQFIETFDRLIWVEFIFCLSTLKFRDCKAPILFEGSQISRKDTNPNK